MVSAYRNEAVAKQLVRYGLEVLAPRLPVQEVFGKAACNHTISQKIGVECGFVDTALELDYIPESAYRKEKGAAGWFQGWGCFAAIRTLCMMFFRRKPMQTS